jgi:phosphonopyruvate decarboxylase
LREGRQAAFVVKKGALSFGEEPNYSNSFVLTREQAIREIVAVSGEDLIVVTTGKASRELFELREELGQGHNRDFLTVGSMGHASSIALGIAVNQPERKVWCIDGDGSVLMHMGGLAVIGSSALDNLVHVVINNMAHESVGGMPTVSGGLDLVEIARACGYAWFAKASTAPELRRLLLKAQEQNRLCFIEAACAIGARGNLCRPTITPKSNKEQFMDCL